MTRTTGTYRGISAEQRRDQRRRRLLDAALDIIGTRGWAATTVRGICEQARVGPRFFYESFDDLDALASALHDELVDSAIRNGLDAIAAAADDLPTKVRAAVAAIIVDLTDDPRRARVVFAEAHGSDTLMRRRFAAMRAIANVVAQQANELIELPGGSETILQGLSLLVTGGVAELVLVWLDGGIDLDREQLIDICVEVLLSWANSLPSIAGKLTRPT